ncbi:MAG: GAF domain-containing protein [Thermoleophilaceae bacterium]
MLVCTTIVESGLDISSANTLIVERADVLGLAQLYQIRGRVGRSHGARLRLPALSLRGGARARRPRRACPTLSDYTELGSGFKIAMRDLEIRGAGDLLGDDQSGHVAAVGFELYVTMLDEAVAALAGDSADEAAGARARGPSDLRLRARRLRALRGGQDRDPPPRVGREEIAGLIVLRDELEDRFGPVPEPLDNLIRLQDARIKLGTRGARTVDFARRAPCRGADRARLPAGGSFCASGCPRPSTSRAVRRCACRCPTTRPHASPRWWRPPRRVLEEAPARQGEVAGPISRPAGAHRPSGVRIRGLCRVDVEKACCGREKPGEEPNCWPGPAARAGLSCLTCRRRVLTRVQGSPRARPGDDAAVALADGALSDPERLEDLHSTGLLETRSVPTLDALTSLARRLLSAGRDGVVGRRGLPALHQLRRARRRSGDSRMPIANSFCRYTVATGEPLMVTDARRSPLLARSRRLAISAWCPYAGAPLETSRGQVLGTLCVLGTEPRRWSGDDEQLLSELAAVAATEIEYRTRTRTMARIETFARELHGLVELLGDSVRGLVADVDGDASPLRIARLAARAHKRFSSIESLEQDLHEALRDRRRAPRGPAAGEPGGGRRARGAPGVRVRD